MKVSIFVTSAFALAALFVAQSAYGQNQDRPLIRILDRVAQNASQYAELENQRRRERAEADLKFMQMMQENQRQYQLQLQQQQMMQLEQQRRQQQMMQANQHVHSSQHQRPAQNQGSRVTPDWRLIGTAGEAYYGIDFNQQQRAAKASWDAARESVGGIKTPSSFRRAAKKFGW